MSVDHRESRGETPCPGSSAGRVKHTAPLKRPQGVPLLLRGRILDGGAALHWPEERWVNREGRAATDSPAPAQSWAPSLARRDSRHMHPNPHEEARHDGALCRRPTYEPPRIEQVLTVEDLARQVLIRGDGCGGRRRATLVKSIPAGRSPAASARL